LHKKLVMSSSKEIELTHLQFVVLTNQLLSWFYRSEFLHKESQKPFKYWVYRVFIIFLERNINQLINWLQINNFQMIRKYMTVYFFLALVVLFCVKKLNR